MARESSIYSRNVWLADGKEPAVKQGTPNDKRLRFEARPAQRSRKTSNEVKCVQQRTCRQVSFHTHFLRRSTLQQLSVSDLRLRQERIRPEWREQSLYETKAATITTMNRP